MEKNIELDPNFIEDLIDSITDFETYLVEMGYEAGSLIDDIYRIINDENKSEYGVLNSIIIFTSSRPEIQSILLNNFLHRLLVDVYTDKIHENPKQMLYGLNQNIIRLGDSPLKHVLAPLLEYAKNHVLLGDDFMKSNQGDKLLDLSDVLSPIALNYKPEIQSLILSTNGKPAKLITLLWAMYRLEYLNESYNYLFSDGIAGYPVQISKIATDLSKRSKPIAHSSVSEYDPRNMNNNANTERLIKEWIKDIKDLSELK